ncbi:PREDICTED: centromere protein J [Papilio xuthus]|uniref:Centromere protein J n=1 Tax=Papilio xuthus TaxID=66420 RepID=A0AAJ7E9C9_PAPXU|nr:PREDICTED: centromere protein J [Papilio xuthus]
MDESYSEGDLSMSPSQILGRLQVLRQLQLLQRGKLQKQQSLYQDSPEMSANLTEIVSHFSNSTSYNTFQSLLQTHEDSSNDVSPRPYISNSSRKLIERDLIDGVSELNLSRESEYLINSPASVHSKVLSEYESSKSPSNHNTKNTSSNKQISLDEIPILTPKKNFEALVVEKLQTQENQIQQKPVPLQNGKRPFLKRGEGMSRFGLQKKDLIIQHTKSLPWVRKKPNNKSNNSDVQVTKIMKEPLPTKNLDKIDVNIVIKKPSLVEKKIEIVNKSKETQKYVETPVIIDTNLSNKPNQKSPIEKAGQKLINLPKGKHPLRANKGKTWAAVLTKEQDDFLRQLKQSEYYKNFSSPSKSITSEMSCDDNMDKIQQDMESSEQKMFELLEKKVTHESFTLENSFINRFLRRNKADCSGESTPLVMQRCLSNNPDLMHISPNLRHENRRNDCDDETCQSECTECVETCSSVSSCSCVTVEPVSNCPCCTECRPNSKEINNIKDNKNKTKKDKPENEPGTQNKKDKESHNDSTDDSNKIKSDMVEMNNKLIATSELLKERLTELEDEIETFRKENANLTKMREEIDVERQKFFEEKAEFEQKFNEEKVLSEYYIAEEKEKLTKQRQLYERYVRDIRGRLNKKDKDEVVNLKKEINDLKEEIRIKDAKSTSMIARLRNQLKLMEKEKKDLQDEVEKLKKENRRIQHSNDVTRRLTNLKYLEQINKKLTNMTSKDSKSEVNIEPNIKYKAFEIERQSRVKKVQSQNKGIRVRAKSVPNLNITSRYAKYFSQKDSLSEIERNKTLNVDGFCTSPTDYMTDTDKIDNLDYSYSSEKTASESEENNLEKIYDERFRSISPASKKSSLNNSSENSNFNDNTSNYFIHKSNSRQHSLPVHQTHLNDKQTLPTKTHSSLSDRMTRSSPTNYTRNSYEAGDFISNYSKESGRNSLSNSHSSKSPTSTLLSNHSSQKSGTIIDQFQDQRIIVTPEPCTSKSSLTKTNLNPTEITKPDGSRELRFPNGNVKLISADGKYSKFVYYNGDVKENFYNEGRMKYFYAETKTYQTTHADGLEVLEFPDGQVEKRYKDGSSEIRLPNGSVRYYDPKNVHVREEWRFPDGAALTVSATGEQRVVFSNGQIEVHTKDHKRREFPDGTVKFVYNDGTSETRYASGRVRIKDKHGNLIMDSAPS